VVDPCSDIGVLEVNGELAFEIVVGGRERDDLDLVGASAANVREDDVVERRGDARNLNGSGNSGGSSSEKEVIVNVVGGGLVGLVVNLATVAPSGCASKNRRGRRVPR
jgi:hypothetical protein